MATWTEKVLAMSLDERRARLEEIRRMAKDGDFSFDYGECCVLQQNIPEEKDAVEQAFVFSRLRAELRISVAGGGKRGLKAIRNSSGN